MAVLDSNTNKRRRLTTAQEYEDIEQELSTSSCSPASAREWRSPTPFRDLEQDVACGEAVPECTVPAAERMPPGRAEPRGIRLHEAVPGSIVLRGSGFFPLRRMSPKTTCLSKAALQQQITRSLVTLRRRGRSFSKGFTPNAGVSAASLVCSQFEVAVAVVDRVGRVSGATIASRTSTGRVMSPASRKDLQLFRGAEADDG
ncbi:hypothetical protein [Streptomyces sp. SID9727]|uniref:hypothetical protein n=1 Tax=Streptomyces sp. SID9727 TaxID=2706114 RepID=UPI00194321FD|nr:hypothetical protein [Streptomyces sp. SID9727]